MVYTALLIPKFTSAIKIEVPALSFPIYNFIKTVSDVTEENDLYLAILWVSKIIAKIFYLI